MGRSIIKIDETISVFKNLSLKNLLKFILSVTAAKAWELVN